MISKLLVDIAEKEGAVAVAHGCTGKGNDQVRFELSIQALNPDLKVIAPVREWGMTRDEQLNYAQEKGIDVPVNKENPFSIDANIWGRACEAGVLEDTSVEAPEEAYDWTNPLVSTPDEPEYLTVEFDQGRPVALNGVKMDLVSLWFSPLKNALEAFVDETQKVVSGTVRLKLHKGHHDVVGRESTNSLYNEELATYLKGDMFDHEAAEGFIKLWGLPTKVFAQVHKNGTDS